MKEVWSASAALSQQETKEGIGAYPSVPEQKTDKIVEMSSGDKKWKNYNNYPLRKVEEE